MPDLRLPLSAAKWLDCDSPAILMRKCEGPDGPRIVLDLMDKRLAEASLYHMNHNNELCATAVRIIQGRRMWKLIDLLENQAPANARS